MTGENKVDDLNQNDYDNIEDGLTASVRELIAINDEFNKAISLLEEDGLNDVAEKLKSVAKHSVANDWCHENL